MPRLAIAAPLLLGITLSLAAAPAAAGPWDGNPKILLHLQPVTSKNVCAWGSLSDCASAVTAGQLATGAGPWYYAYVLAAPGPGGNIAGVELGIDYQNSNSADVSDQDRIDIFEWHVCATLEFITPGAHTWPRPGGGNLITWDSVNRCQTGETAVAGYFYLACYSSPDTLMITPRPVSGHAKVASCASIETVLFAGDLGRAVFSASGTAAGCNPCAEGCPDQPDDVPPASVTSLEVTGVSSHSVTLRWNAPGDDGVVGYAHVYDFRYSTVPIDETIFAAATSVSGEPSPGLPTEPQTMTVNGLAPATTWYFAFRTADEAGNWSGLSNVVSGTTDPVTETDVSPPAAIVNLQVTGAWAGSVTLQWTAPGDDGATGTAASYDIRYSLQPITTSNYGSATAAIGEPIPATAGTVQSMTVPGLAGQVPYYFAMKTADEVPNWSGLSNVVTGTPPTGPPGSSDTIPPAAITDLRVTGRQYSTLTLAWTAPGDDGTAGQATAYEMRYSRSPIDDLNWAAATPANGLAAPATPGSPQTFVVTGLWSHTTYYFAMKTRDEIPNWSALSNVAEDTTLALPSNANSNARLLLHMTAVTTGNPCVLGNLTDCRNAVVSNGPLYPALRFVYLLAGWQVELSGVRCGITYDGGLADGQANHQNLDIYSWSLCASMETPSLSPRAWPAPGSGNLIQWTGEDACQRTAIPVAGYFYVGAYARDQLRLTPYPGDPAARVDDCSGGSVSLASAALGYVGFATFGYDPCVDDPRVPVRLTTWSGIKTLFE